MSEETSAQSADVQSVKTGTVATPSALDRFGEYITARASLEAPIVREELSSAQMEAILNATTEEELDAAMQMAGLVGFNQIDDGTEIQINGWHLAPGTRSDIANRWGVFAVLECTLLASAQPVNIDTGVERIITWLRVQENLGGFPVQRRVVKVKTGSGNEMVTLLPLTKRVVPGN